MDRKEIASILAAAGAKPRHNLGQNFMVDQAALRAIADAGEIGESDVVLEVGPGVGNLTRLLAQRACHGHVLAVDIDQTLMSAAQRHHAGLANVTWLHADALAGKHKIEPRVLEELRRLRRQYPDGELKLVSNLPYNAASPLVAELLVAMWRDFFSPHGGPSHHMTPAGTLQLPAADENAALSFSRFAFTVQWEVGQRMSAKPDTRDYGPLGILIQAMADVQTVRKIAPGAFWPPPKIQSGLIVVIPRLEKMRLVRDAEALQRFLAGIFSHRRQTLGNALKHFCGKRWEPEWKEHFREAGFDLSQRPENLGIAQLLRLEETLEKLTRPTTNRG